VTYQSQAEQYTNVDTRNRVAMCAREQAHIFVSNPDPATAALATGVVAGDWTDIDALIVGVIVGPNGATLDDDAALLGAMQATWPTVAAARYPQEG